MPVIECSNGKCPSLFGSEENNHMILQEDGNLVIYNKYKYPIWASNSHRSTFSNYELHMQKDGNLVIYTPDGHPIWASNTNHDVDNQFKLIFDDTRARFHVVRLSDHFVLFSNANKHFYMNHMENNCTFINSRGILKSCDFHSPSPRSSCDNDKDYLHTMLYLQKENMTIYVCSDLIPYFVNDILSNIKLPFILVTGDSDMMIPNEISRDIFHRLLQYPLLLKWYAQNCVAHHPKLHCLPIGLDYHTISDNPSHAWKKHNERPIPIFQEQLLQNILQDAKPFYERIPKILINFSQHNDRYHQRRSLLSMRGNDIFVEKLHFHSRSDIWKEYIKYTFIASPSGIGIDCHRTWEALVLGCIPILISNPVLDSLFHDLPVILVRQWTDLTQEFLFEKIQELKTKHFNLEKLKLHYWINLISSKPYSE